MKITIKKLPKSEVEIEGELEADIFENYFNNALKKISGKVKIDGFRQGKIPENIILQNIGEMPILEEMAEMALGEHYPKILENEKIDAIGRPEISITKIARNNPLGFKIKTAILGDVKLADYKSLAKKITSANKEVDTNISDEEMESTILDIRKSRAQKKHPSEDVITEEKDGENTENKKQDLPDFNDEFVQALGPFVNVEDFKEKLKENLKLEKQNSHKEKIRLQIIEDIIKDSVIDLPDILIEVELNKILYRMESDIAQMGLKFEDYLKQINKTVDDLKKEFTPDAEKKAKLAILLNEIAKTEKIVVNEEQLAKEVTAILEHYKDADPERARMHAENVLINEQIFQFLENL